MEDRPQIGARGIGRVLALMIVFFHVATADVQAKPEPVEVFYNPSKMVSLVPKEIQKVWSTDSLADHQLFGRLNGILEGKKSVGMSLAEVQNLQTKILLIAGQSPTNPFEKEFDDAFWVLELEKAAALTTKKEYRGALRAFHRVITRFPSARWPFYWRTEHSAKLLQVIQANKKKDDVLGLQIAKRVVEVFPKAALETAPLRTLNFSSPISFETGGDRFSQVYPSKGNRDEVSFEAILECFLADRLQELQGLYDGFIAEFPKSTLRIRAQFFLAELQWRRGKKKEAEVNYRSVLDAAPLGFYALVSMERLGLSPKDLVKKQPILVDPDQFNFNILEWLSIQRMGELLKRKNLAGVERELECFKRTRNYSNDTVLFLMMVAHRAGAALNSFRWVSEMIDRQYQPLLDSSLLDVIFPWNFENEIGVASKAYSIDPLVVQGLIKQESGFRVNAISSSGALGLMQLMPFTAIDVKKDLLLSKLNDPSTNIGVGTEYLQSLLLRYGGNLPLGLAAYNAGPSRVARWRKDMKPEWGMIEYIESIPYKETRDYVTSILRNRFWYQFRKGQAPSSLFESWKPETLKIEN